MQSAIASHSGSYLLLNDISDVAFNDTTSVWTSAIKLYGRGHSLKNVTVNGKGMFGGVVNGLVLKDVAIKVTAVSLESGYVGLIGNEMQNSTFENVYLETSHKLNNASYTSSKYKNVILNCGGNTFNKADSDTETNVISVNDSFFDAYSQGLPAGFENSGFEIKADGLYFGTNLLLAK